jgi:hypothetical protein
MVLFVAVVAFATAQMACMDREPAPVCPVPTELNQTAALVGGFEGVDMLVMVDNSRSMSEEQAILATVFFPLINSLVNPLPNWDYPPADDVRVAVISSDLGLSWGGQAYTEGDGWPTSLPEGCNNFGDSGVFKTYGAGKTVSIQHDVIDCGSVAQCPAGWTCNAAEGGIGKCQAPGGNGANQLCPALTATWAETPIGPEDAQVPNPNLAFQVSCLSALGTVGCGFEQQLQSAAYALNRDDQASFTREKALLAVLMVTDEEDCSIQSKQLFMVPEIQNMGDGRVNVACNLDANEQYLYDPSHYYQTFQSASGTTGGTVFAAIVGVPAGDDSPCQGAGNTIGQCLDHTKMQNIQVEEPSGSGTAWFFQPACNRMDGAVEVTKARPGRRFVSLAQQFDNMGYVYSICNADWSPAMMDIAKLIAENLAGTCYPKPLDWDPASKQAKCDVVVQYDFGSEDEAVCPAVFEAEEPLVEEWVDADDVTQYRVYCPLPRLTAEKECKKNDFSPGSPLMSQFGWYYCENAEDLDAENFNEACNDGLDNDNNGSADCDDPGCEPCAVCGGNGMGCAKTCKYKVELTDTAKELVRGLNISVQCLQQFSFTDPNCQENTERSCNDEKDNDGNGIWDCDNVTSGDNPHYADFNCCPMKEVNKGEPCEVLTHDYCPGSSNTEPSGACRQHASLLQCTPPW